MIGNSIDLFVEPFESYHRWQREYGDAVYADWIVAEDGLYVFTHPDAIREVTLEKNDLFVKGAIQEDVFSPVTGEHGLFLSHGEEWAERRTLTQPAFYPRRIAGYGDTMVEHTDRLAGDWRAHERLPIHDAMNSLAARIIAATFFGEDIHGKESVLGRASDAITAKYDASSPNYYLPGWVPTPTNRRFEGAIDDLDARIDRLVHERRREGTEHDDLLAMILGFERDADADLPPDVLRDIVKGFLFGGLGTTTLMLTNVWEQLGHNPDAERKLHAEVDDVLDGDRPTVEDLSELTYTQQVIEETLRHRPPVYTLFREATEDVTIDGYRVPEGGTLALPQHVVHHDERYYDDPSEFRPERWTDDFEDGLDDCAYFPFGFGPEQCIAGRYARMLARLVVPTIARQYALDPVADEPVDRIAAITAQPETDVVAWIDER